MTELLHQGWKEYASRDPDRIAIRDQDTAWSYQQLFMEAAKIRNSLPADPDSDRLVAIYGDKSPESIAAILGALDAGYGYVAITPWAEPELLRQNLEVGGLDTMITTALQDYQQDALQALPPEYRPKRILDLSETLDNTHLPDTEFIRTGETEKGFPWTQTADDIAYGLFTSGSTGQSKLVLVPHRAAVTAIGMYQKDVPVTSDMVVGSQVPLCFDLSVFDIFATLSRGATIELIPNLAFTGRLLEYIQSSDISSIFTVPSIMSHEIKRTGPDNLKTREDRSLKRLLFSGEPIPESLIEHLHQIFPDTEIWNMYGATEFPYALSKKVDTGRPDQANIFSMKQNSGNSPVRIRCEDDSQHGELLVGGDVLFKEYKTIEGTAKTYQRIDGFHPTGDLASIDKDDLKLHGRCSDSQVKIEGVRLDLREIEREIEKDDRVVEAASVPSEDFEHLHLYVTLKAGQRLEPVPVTPICDYTYHVLDGYIPRTHSGKKDRQALLRK